MENLEINFVNPVEVVAEDFLGSKITQSDLIPYIAPYLPVLARAVPQAHKLEYTSDVFVNFVLRKLDHVRMEASEESLVALPIAVAGLVLNYGDRLPAVKDNFRLLFDRALGVPLGKWKKRIDDLNGQIPYEKSFEKKEKLRAELEEKMAWVEYFAEKQSKLRQAADTKLKEAV